MDGEIKSFPGFEILNPEGLEHPFDRLRQVSGISEGMIRVPNGETLFSDTTIHVIAPEKTNFPVDAGIHVQVVNKKDDLTTQTLHESPLFSGKYPVKEALKTCAIAIASQQSMYHEPNTAWTNLNIRTDGVVSREMPFKAPYDNFTVDIQGRTIGDRDNLWRPTPYTGEWGVLHDQVAQDDRVGDATAAEINTYKAEPKKIERDVAKPEDFEGWMNDPQGSYGWDFRRRVYTPAEKDELKALYQSFDFKEKIKWYKKIDLFTDENPPKQFTNDDQGVIWEWGRYRLVTENNPLIDRDQGIHMVLKVKSPMGIGNEETLRSPHAPFEDPTISLEMLAIGLSVARLLQKTHSMGKMDKAYLDFNSNWGKPMFELSRYKEYAVDELKKIFYNDAGMHLHIQLGKIGEYPEIPPTKGTFQHEPITNQALTEIRSKLGNDKTGLTPLLMATARGKIF